MRTSLILLFVLGATARADVSAPAGRAAAAVHWLTARDGLPAAVTGSGAIASPDDATACRWVTVGSRWRVLDSLGAVVGETRVRKLESSEPWPCLMATLSGPHERGRLLVAAAAVPPAPTRAWTPAASERAAFAALLRGRASERRMLFFEMRGGRFAAGSAAHGVALVARLVDGGWRVEWDGTRRPVHDDHRVESYESPAAIDLDGDGDPEVLFTWFEDTVYGDYVLRRDGDGWRVIAESFPGNTI
jgi:hypothetical protein